MELRRIFDTIPDTFDRYRPRYCPELFEAVIEASSLTSASSVLELGPGTGQATAPILHTGCDYHAIELGENFAALLQERYGHNQNFHLINDDFITHDFGSQQFDLIYSAATIQWIPENIAFSKTFDLLKPGGTLAMFLTRSDYRTPNEGLYQQIQQVYNRYFHPSEHYRQVGFGYRHAVDYGYTNLTEQHFSGKRVLTADEYVAYSGTHCDHIALKEPYRTPFFEGLHQAVLDAGDAIVFLDTFVLYLANEPLQ